MRPSFFLLGYNRPVNSSDYLFLQVSQLDSDINQLVVTSFRPDSSANFQQRRSPSAYLSSVLLKGFLVGAYGAVDSYVFPFRVPFVMCTVSISKASYETIG
ncbi:MAG: hypothetical protein EZS28_001132 [Streblomastix strix]|uniref:Uncharacterized protein n=1 Tax=Streblomastix strix TaxID=222440 RepID=A0A5J4X7Z1_9EUKA|nr:MAG: hypothetical protein EZS28_001132 [Streblomastix strix]